MNKIKRQKIFQALADTIPKPKTELVYKSNYQLLVAVILSAQATDISVNKATTKLYKIANTPEKIIKLGEEGLKEYIRSIGLYNAKAKNIIAMSKILLAKHKGAVPKTLAELEALPGVGRKTANVVLNVAFGVPTIAVDTHVFRVANRTKIGPGKTPLQVEQALVKHVPEEFKLYAHHWLILHGRHTCMARKPKCEKCCIHGFCEYSKKN